MSTLLLTWSCCKKNPNPKSSAENPSPERNPGLKRTQTGVIFKVINMMTTFKSQINLRIALELGGKKAQILTKK
jgi:ABC-type lipoprotein export system ATPase subunit